jgi:hypothetical protein
MDPILSVSYSTIASFLEAANGNFRNSIYVSCTCDYRRESGCGDFLFVPGHDCIPIILPLSDAENFLGKIVDKSECASTLSSRCFIQLYHKWIELATSSSDECPIQQLLHVMNKPKKW